MDQKEVKSISEETRALIEEVESLYFIGPTFLRGFESAILYPIRSSGNRGNRFVIRLLSLIGASILFNLLPFSHDIFSFPPAILFLIRIIGVSVAMFILFPPTSHSNLLSARRLNAIESVSTYIRARFSLKEFSRISNRLRLLDQELRDKIRFYRIVLAFFGCVTTFSWGIRSVCYLNMTLNYFLQTGVALSSGIVFILFFLLERHGATMRDLYGDIQMAIDDVEAEIELTSDRA